MIRLTACVLLASATMISSLHAGDLPIQSTSSTDEYEVGSTFQTTEPSAIMGDDYALVFADISYSVSTHTGRGVTVATTTVGEWWEIPYLTSTTPFIELTNNLSLSEPVVLSNVGFFTSPTLIPLEDLNFTPPPSKTTPITAIPNETSLAFGASTSPIALPEPNSLWLAALGGAFQWVIRARSRRLA